MKNVFNETHVGQKVSSPMQGNGVIIEFNTGKVFPVVVVGDENGEINAFAVCGRAYKSHIHPSLVFGHREASSYTCGTPKTVLKPLVLKDKPVLAYVSDISLETALSSKIKKLILGIGYYDPRGLSYFTVEVSNDLNNTSHIDTWKYAIAVPNEKKEEEK